MPFSCSRPAISEQSGDFTIRFLGDDYLDKDFTGSHLNIPIHYISRDHGWSTTKFKKAIKNFRATVKSSPF